MYLQYGSLCVCVCVCVHVCRYLYFLYHICMIISIFHVDLWCLPPSTPPPPPSRVATCWYSEPNCWDGYTCLSCWHNLSLLPHVFFLSCSCYGADAHDVGCQTVNQYTWEIKGYVFSVSGEAPRLIALLTCEYYFVRAHSRKRIFFSNEVS